MKLLFLSFLVCVGLAFGQATTPSTTFSVSTDASQSSVTLGSGAGVVVGSTLYSGREGMTVTRLINGTTFGVIRAQVGRRQIHTSGSTVYVVAPGSAALTADDPGPGNCTAAHYVTLPMINTDNGNIWNCTGGIWVNASSGGGATTLTGDVSGPVGSNSVGSVGGSSAAAINTATVAANGAVSAATPSKIVVRDGSGNASFGTVTAALNGTASGNIPTGQKGAASGVGSLDGTGRQTATEAPGVTGDVTIPAGTIVAKLTPLSTTVAGLGAAASNTGRMALVTNGTNNTDCVTGGGSTRVLCYSNGTTWLSFGGGTGSGLGDSGSNGIVKRNGAGTSTLAIAETDYSLPVNFKLLTCVGGGNGDGTTGVSDNSALTAALATGRTVVIDPASTCYFFKVTLPSNSRLFGVPGRSLVKPYDAGQSIIDSRGTSASNFISNVTVSGITFDALNGTLFNGATGVLNFKYNSNLTIDNNVVLSSGGNLLQGVGIVALDSDARIINNDVSGINGDGIRIQMDNNCLSPASGGGFHTGSSFVAFNKVHDNPGTASQGGDGIRVTGPTGGINPVTNAATSVTLSPCDETQVTNFTASSAVTQTLNAAGDVPTHGSPWLTHPGWRARYVNSTAFALTVARGVGSPTINGGTSSVTVPSLTAYEIYTPDGVNWTVSSNRSLSASPTLVATDCGTTVYRSFGSSETVTLPVTSQLPTGSQAAAMCYITINNTGANTVAIAAQNAAPPQGTSPICTSSGTCYAYNAFPNTIPAGGAAFAFADGSRWKVFVGTLSNASYNRPAQEFMNIPVSIVGNQIWNQGHRTSDTGASGNGVHVTYSRNVTVQGNTMQGTDYSCYRGSSSGYITVQGNLCEGAGETGIYEEFASNSVRFIGNHVKGAKGIGMAMDNAFPTLSNTADWVSISAIMTGNFIEGSGSGNACIKVEATAIIAENIVDNCATIGIQIGNGSSTNSAFFFIQVSNNLIKSSLNTPNQASTAVYTQGGLLVQRGVTGYTNVIVDGNQFDLPSTVQQLGMHSGGTRYGTTMGAGVLIRNQTLTFAQLGTPDPGSRVFVSDADDPGASAVGTCTSAGAKAGAEARYNGIAWKCF